MTSKIAILTAAIALSAGPSFAQSAYVWESVSSGPTGTLSYNPVTVSRANGAVTFTVKVQGATSTSLTASTPSGQTINPAYYVERMQIACAASTYADLEMTTYDASGNVLTSQTNVHGMEPVSQSNVAQTMQAKLCN